MKKKLLLAMLMIISVAGMAQLNTPRTSPQASVSQTVGVSEITVKYSRPNVMSPQGQDRTGNVWGSLVHYGFTDFGFGTAKEAPWRAGADESTTIKISHDVKVEGQVLPAGKYSLFMAVEEPGDVTVIFNKRTTDWGSYFYDKNEDALRVKVQSIENANTSLLTYNFIEADSKNATLVLDWEKKRIPVKFEFNTPEIVYAAMKNDLQGDKGFNAQSWMQGAGFLLSNNIHLDEALIWATNAIEGQFYSVENFQGLQLKASILAALGKEEQSAATMKQALEHPTAFINDYYNYGRQLISQKKAKEAFEVFKTANKKWPEHWLAPHGLARGYSANGDYKSALKYERQAFAKAPEGSKQFIEGYLKTLEEGKDFN